MTAIRAAFGNGVLTEDGALNRAAMRALAFESQDARKRLEGILHPMIRQESERQCLAASAPYVILAVPLLIESGTYRERVQRLCVVDCPEAMQVVRVMQRGGLEERLARIGRPLDLEALDDVVRQIERVMSKEEKELDLRMADLRNAIEYLRDNPHRLDDCIRELHMSGISKAELWNRIKRLNP